MQKIYNLSLKKMTSLKIGFVGIGKLGLPICVGMSAVGHDVLGYDIADRYCQLVSRPQGVTAEELLTSKETTPDGKQDLKTSSLLRTSSCRFTSSLTALIQHAEFVFCAVQTPHEPQYEGITCMPESRADFDYSYLVQAVQHINVTAEELKKETILVIISTVLPGSIRKHIIPILGHYIKLVYNPYFIAMGSVLPDFFHPEFVLIGIVDEYAKQKLIEFYKTITTAPLHITNLETAEMIKVSYNTFITAKICLANQIMIMCDKLEHTNADDVMKALFLGQRRIISNAYLTGGLGDGGGCHPRDGIALSWLSSQLQLPFNFYDGLMRCREMQTFYLVQLIQDYHLRFPELPIILLGKSFKAETDLTIGSPALLLKSMCEEAGLIVEHYDPFLDTYELKTAVYCLATRHTIFQTTMFPTHSIVIDPFRFLHVKSEDKIIYHPVGASKRTSF
jgi:UDPglucose 6-dehydrogenase